MTRLGFLSTITPRPIVPRLSLKAAATQRDAPPLGGWWSGQGGMHPRPERKRPRWDAPPPRPKGPLAKGLRPLSTSIPYIGPQIDGLTNAELGQRIKDAGWCEGVNNDDWFPAEPTTEHGRLAYVQQARRQCANCPAADECPLLALRYEVRMGVQPHGIWGGRAPWERESLLRPLRRRGGGIAAARTVLGVAS